MSLPYIVIDGRAVADAELKFTQSGRAFAKFRVAANDSKKDDAGNWETTETLFVNVTAWDDAERIATEVTRGAGVTVAGKIHEREYEHDGEKRRSLEIKFPMVSVRPARDQQQAAPQQAGGWGAPPAPAAPADPWGAPAPTDQAPF